MLTINALTINDEQFEIVVKNNPDLNFEQTASGELVIVPPTGGTSGKRNSNLTYQLEAWNLASGEPGVTFDSNTMFVLPNGAKRMPDVAYVRRDRWQSLTKKQQDGYVPLCPDLVIELRSPTDSLEELQAKMQEYINNGAIIGLLIDPLSFQVHIYRQNMEVEIVDSPTLLFGEELLSGFSLNLQRIWN